MTVRQAIAAASLAIDRRDAELLLRHVLNRDRVWLLAHPEAELSPADRERLHALAARRALHEPLQYLLGRQEFFGLDLRVTRDVLIPRPETELLVESVVDWARAHGRQRDGLSASLHILDVGTGSGAIALAIASQLPGAIVTAVDLSPAALEVARANAERLGLRDRIHFLVADLLEAAEPDLLHRTPWDVIVSNPPYVPQSEAAALQPEVRDFEPAMALFGGADGLAVYRRLIPQAREALRPGGLLALEFGLGQAHALTELLRGWRGMRILDDLAGIPRIVLAERQ